MCIRMSDGLYVNAGLANTLREVREATAHVSVELANKIGEGVRRGLGLDLAAQREGFGRFCRETLGLEPATLLAAMETPPREYEVVAADPAKVAEHVAWWNERWARRFPP
jgi:hypothetical protein